MTTPYDIDARVAALPSGCDGACVVFDGHHVPREKVWNTFAQQAGLPDRRTWDDWYDANGNPR